MGDIAGFQWFMHIAQCRNCDYYLDGGICAFRVLWFRNWFSPFLSCLPYFSLIRAFVLKKMLHKWCTKQLKANDLPLVYVHRQNSLHCVF